MVAHHLLRAGGKGLATKACDSLAVPLHHECHQSLHLHGDEVDWFNLRGLDYDAVVELASILAAQSPDEKIRGIA